MRRSSFLVGMAITMGFVLQSAAQGYEAQQVSYQSVAEMEYRLAELEAQLASVEQASYQTSDAEDSYLPPNPEGAVEPNYIPDGGYGGCNSCYGGGYAGGYSGDCGSGYCGGGYGDCSNNGYYDGCGSCGLCDGVYGSCGCGDSGCGCEPSCGCGSGYCGCGDGCGCGCEPSCGCGYGDCGGCRTGGFVYSGEFLMLRPQRSEAYGSQSKFEDGSRFTFGYTNACDQTIRARYFEYGANELFGDNGFLRMEMLDLEYAGGFCLGRNWTGEVGAGVRWASYDEEFELRYDDSVGPEIGVELRSCPWHCASVFASVRQSLQFGHPVSYDGNTFDREDLGSFGITEMQIGLEWKRCCRGNTIYCRGTFEAQDWNSVAGFDSEDQRLIGWGFTVGVTR